MHTTRTSCFDRLGAVFGLGLALAASACSGGSGDADTSTGSTTLTSTGDGTSGSTGSSTTDPTTGSTGSSTTPTPTTGATLDTTGSSSTTLDETTTDPTTGGTDATTGTTGPIDEPSMSMFVSSTGSATGDLGGLAGADKRCQDLAAAVGAGDRTWHAYLSVEEGPVHAKDRIGTGPWYNAKLVMVAADVADLHTKDGDAELFLDENGEKVPGQWEGSPDPNQHDILTGTNVDGTVAAGKTCADWTSEDAALLAQVGHSDGLGPNMSDAEQYRSWNSVHESGGCNDTAPKGGAGRVYCFAID